MKRDEALPLHAVIAPYLNCRPAHRAEVFVSPSRRPISHGPCTAGTPG